MSQAMLDLLWVVNSPSFVRGDNVAPEINLGEADIDVEALDAFLAERPVHRVGRYFENLLHFWLAEIRRVDMIGAGIQLRDGNRTIGELDFLYRDEAGIVVHCEAAVKFFLHIERARGSHYPGPNAADDFERKTAKLFDQQLELSRLHYPEVQLRHAFVKGVVFYRPGSAAPGDEPARMSADHLRGSWMSSSDLNALGGRPGLVGAVAQKPHWFAPDVAASLTPIAELAANLQADFEEPNPKPRMVSLRDMSSSEEVDRVFVVPPGWPGVGRE